jgi:Na+/proline symporter
MSLIALLLGLVWGGVWAAFLQFHPRGQWLVVRRTWITVVIGVGVDVLICKLFLPWEPWLYVVGVVLLSSVCIIARSLYNESREDEDVLNEFYNATREQDDLGA